eukprot:3383485-Rhodomonas_salina.2
MRAQCWRHAAGMKGRKAYCSAEGGEEGHKPREPQPPASHHEPQRWQTAAPPIQNSWTRTLSRESQLKNRRTVTDRYKKPLKLTLTVLLTD